MKQSEYLACDARWDRPRKPWYREAMEGCSCLLGWEVTVTYLSPCRESRCFYRIEKAKERAFKIGGID